CTARFWADLSYW
nr:immunoglobulin heavy chain junction region [Macaca mulatta]